MNRRRFLATGVALALAGCSGDGSGGDGGGTTPVPTTEPTPTPTAEPSATLESHPAARALDAQPTLGPDPGEATGVVVMFEDPSCPRCARFEAEVVPQLRSELVEPGTVSLVFRGYPVIYPWGEPATAALEAVYDADPAAHWGLLAYFFGQQSSFVGSEPPEVFDAVEGYLDAQTDLDAAAVADAARNGEYDDAVGTDLDAGQAAGAGRTTPHLFMFRDGAFRSKSAGFTGLTTIKSVLGV